MSKVHSRRQPPASSLQPAVPGLFLAGTGTEVGKTHIGCLIARALVAAGRRVGVYKPVASGCRHVGAELIADDAVALAEAAGRRDELSHVCPQRFEAALAPSRAARLEGRQVDVALLRTGVDYWRATSDVVVVEGAGGLMSPLADQAYNIDLAAELGYPLVIVAANKLGAINAVLQTVITAQTRAPQLPIAGIVLNRTRPPEGDASLATNAEEIAARAPAPLLASIGFGERAFPAGCDWMALARGRDR